MYYSRIQTDTRRIIHRSSSRLPCSLRRHQTPSNLTAPPQLNLQLHPIHRSNAARISQPTNQKSIVGEPPSLLPKPLLGHLSTMEDEGFRTVLSKRTLRRLRTDHFQQSISIEATTFRFGHQGTALLITEQRPSLFPTILVPTASLQWLRETVSDSIQHHFIPVPQWSYRRKLITVSLNLLQRPGLLPKPNGVPSR